jgi:hypothetical protein
MKGRKIFMPFHAGTSKAGKIEPVGFKTVDHMDKRAELIWFFIAENAEFARNRKRY